MGNGLWVGCGVTELVYVYIFIYKAGMNRALLLVILYWCFFNVEEDHSSYFCRSAPTPFYDVKILFFSPAKENCKEIRHGRKI